MVFWLFKQHVYCNYNITHLNKTFLQICMNRNGMPTVHQCILCTPRNCH